MSAFEECPNASHRTFPYYFDDNYGICFGPCGWTGPSLPWKYNNDLAIYYGNMGSNDYIDCKCSRWDVQNFSIIVETWLTKSQVQTLLDNITPGAVDELYKILGKPHHYDSTWQSENTLKFLPAPSSNDMGGSTLKKMRNTTIGYVKNVVLHPIPFSKGGWISTKLECLISGNQDL